MSLAWAARTRDAGTAVTVLIPVMSLSLSRAPAELDELMPFQTDAGLRLHEASGGAYVREAFAGRWVLVEAEFACPGVQRDTLVAAGATAAGGRLRDAGGVLEQGGETDAAAVRVFTPSVRATALGSPMISSRGQPDTARRAASCLVPGGYASGFRSASAVSTLGPLAGAQ